VVVLFLILFYKGFRVAANTRDPFLSLLAGGITFQIAIQAFINMGVVTGLLPCTGIPLPLVSFGGSSLVITLFSLGLLLNIAGLPDPSQARSEVKGLEKRARFTTSGSVSGHLPTVKDVAVARRIAGRVGREEQNKASQGRGESECGSSSPGEEPGATFTPL
jgi:hypothetical protein